MSDEIKLELDRRNRVRRTIASAERIFAEQFADYIQAGKATIPAFTEAEADAFLKDCSTFHFRWIPAYRQMFPALAK